MLAGLRASRVASLLRSVRGFTVLLLAAFAPAVFAQVSTSGDVTAGATSPIWNVGGNLIVGDSGTGALTIGSGGAVSNTDAIIGYDLGPTGTVTVAGGTWTNSDRLYVGFYGNGTLNLNSGTVSNGTGQIGFQPGSTGTVTVAGGTWTNSEGLYVGNLGTGTLNLNGGVVTATQVLEGSSGSGNVNFNGGTLRLSANQAYLFDGFGTGDIQIQAGGGTIDTQAFSVATAVALEGAGGLAKVGSGSLTLSGASTYTGATTVSAGSLVINGSLASAVTVNSGASFSGTGALSNGLTLESGSSLNFALGTGFSSLDITGGNLVFNGPITLNLTDAGDFDVGTTYNLIDASSPASISSLDTGIFTINGPSGYTQSLVWNGSILQFTVVSAVPEPSTYAAIFGVSVLGFAAWRKRRAAR